MIDIFYGVLGVAVVIFGVVLAVLVVVPLYIFLGWLVALGLLAYGQSILAFWAFVAWLVCLFLFRLAVG